MGIDVWMLRPAVPVEPVDEAKPEEQIEAPVSQPVAEDTPEFTLAFVHYGTVGLCLSLESGQTEIPRRFCDDLARSMGGNLEAARFQKLEWPMVKSPGIDQSIETAREVVAEKLDVLPPTVLMFGEDIKIYFAPLADHETGTIRKVQGRSIALFESSLQVMASATHKSTVWHVISSLRKS